MAKWPKDDPPPKSWDELIRIHRRHMQQQTSPKYAPWEIEARAWVRTYIQKVGRMNFDSGFEGAFVLGAQFIRGEVDKHPYTETQTDTRQETK